jgi:hypothetical protein
MGQRVAERIGVRVPRRDVCRRCSSAVVMESFTRYAYPLSCILHYLEINPMLTSVVAAATSPTPPVAFEFKTRI